MYNLASAVFKNDDKYLFKARNCVVCREFLAFKYVFMVFSKANQMIIYICTSDFETRVFGTQYPIVFVLAGT